MLSTFGPVGSDATLSPQIGEFIDSFFVHAPPPLADKWAEDSIYLPKKVSTFEGPFSFTLIPWLREIVQSINDPDCRSGVFVCGTQSAKTTALKILTLYATTVLRINAVWLWPKAELGRSFSLTKFKPTIEASDALRRFIPANSDLFKNLEMHFEGGGTLNFVGSHSKVDSKSRSAGLVASDEIDDCAAKTENDADPITLLQERTKTFIEAKEYRFGSPTIATRPAWQTYLLGDQRHYFLPCPHCGTWQSLELRDQVWQLEGITGALPDRHTPLPSTCSAVATGRAGDFHLRWDPEARLSDREWDFDRVAATSRYYCVSCDQPIMQEEKNHLVESEACRWFPTVRARSEGCRSWRLPALYPLWPGTTFAKNATKFLQTHHTIAGEQSYFNNWRALPFGRGHDTTDRAALRRLATMILGDHAMGERVGDKTLLLVDVQRHYVVWAWFGFTPTSIHLLDANTARDFDAIRELDDRLSPDFVAIDTRHRAQEVYAAVLQRRPRWIAIRGEKTGTPLKPNYQFDPFTGQRDQGIFQILLLHLNTYSWGEEILARIYPPKEAADALPEFARPRESAPLDPAAPADNPKPRINDFFLARDMPDRSPHMLTQLYNEYIVEYLDAKGKLVRKWTENKNNHLFDLAKYALAVGSFLQLTRLHSEAAAKLASAVAAAKTQDQLPLNTPHGGAALYHS
jgi:hypothetical protein